MQKWDPLRDIFILRERVNKLFEDVSSRAGGRDSGVWTPAVDVYETPGEFIVTAELPEVPEPDINIRIEENTLRISGERSPHREGKNYHQVERCYGPFLRSFALPATVDKDNIKATLRDGILKIVLPKKDGEQPKQIDIK